MPSVSWRRLGAIAAADRLDVDPEGSACLIGDPNLARLGEFRGQLVADVVGVGQLGDLAHVRDRLSQVHSGAIRQP
jgi:hypothetical protein